MQIYRGRHDEPTDSQDPSDYIERWQHRLANWHESGGIHFDGTVDKYGAKHTDLWIDICEDDVLALFDGLVKAYESRAGELRRWCRPGRPTHSRDHSERFATGVDKLWHSFLNTGIRLRRMIRARDAGLMASMNEAEEESQQQ